MKIVTKSRHNAAGAPSIDYQGVPGDPATSSRWCVINPSAWTYNHGGKTPVVRRERGGGWYVCMYGAVPPPELKGVRFPSRASIIAALLVSA